MKRIYVLSVWVCLLLGMSSCTKDNFAYSGISKARFDGNMLEYMDAHPDLTAREAFRRARSFRKRSNSRF